MCFSHHFYLIFQVSLRGLTWHDSRLYFWTGKKQLWSKTGWSDLIWCQWTVGKWISCKLYYNSRCNSRCILHQQHKYLGKRLMLTRKWRQPHVNNDRWLSSRLLWLLDQKKILKLKLCYHHQFLNFLFAFSCGFELKEMYGAIVPSNFQDKAHATFDLKCMSFCLDSSNFLFTREADNLNLKKNCVETTIQC